MISAFVILISFLSMILGIDEAEIVFAGDAMMHQAQIDAARCSDGTYDFNEYFEDIRPYVESADYAVVNLETPVSTPPYSGYPCFNAPDSYLDALSDAGFDLFLTANNHTLDRRDNGLRNTVDALDSRHLEHIGTYKNNEARNAALPFIKNINGIKVGFVNYTYGTNGIQPGNEVKVDYIDRDVIKEDVRQTRDAGAEIIIACVHWGVEYQLLPHEVQKSLARYLHELGVEVIIGGHPHVVQPMELESGEQPSLLVYSLGNFISNMKTCETRGGALVKVRLLRDNSGKARVEEASYRLVFTEPADSHHNYRLRWVDHSDDPRATAFSRSARKLFNSHNRNVHEDIPGAASWIRSKMK